MRCVWTCFLSRSSAAALGVAIALPVLYFCRRRCRPPTTPEDVVLITGCDSGLGFSLALHAHSRGLTVVATCLDAHSPGAQLLKVEGGRMHVIQVDVTDLTSINAAVRDVTSLLDQNPQLSLLDAGMGPTQINTFLSALNIPHLSETLVKRHERLTGPSIESEAQSSCEEMIVLEKSLTQLSTEILPVPSTCDVSPILSVTPHNNEPTPTPESNIRPTPSQPVLKAVIAHTSNCNEAASTHKPISPPTTPSAPIPVANLNLPSTPKRKQMSDSAMDVEEPEPKKMRLICSYDMGWQCRGNGKCYNSQSGLKALVNNAAVMVFGEFEWQTERQIRQQVEVNLLGTMSVTHKFCSLLRKHQGRIIIVSSHCALASLPGLAPYGATKGALKNWADSLRVELAKYGVHVISFVPGSFIDKSNIMTRHTENVREMEAAMSPESKAFYMNYFHNYHAYLGALSVPKGLPMKMEDASQYALFESALFSPYPKPIYINQPPRYAFYHFLFKVTPTWLRDRFVERFVQMPRWCP